MTVRRTDALLGETVVALRDRGGGEWVDFDGALAGVILAESMSATA